MSKFSFWFNVLTVTVTWCSWIHFKIINRSIIHACK